MHAHVPKITKMAAIIKMSSTCPREMMMSPELSHVQDLLTAHQYHASEVVCPVLYWKIKNNFMKTEVGK